GQHARAIGRRSRTIRTNSYCFTGREKAISITCQGLSHLNIKPAGTSPSSLEQYTCVSSKQLLSVESCGMQDPVILSLERVNLLLKWFPLCSAKCTISTLFCDLFNSNHNIT